MVPHIREGKKFSVKLYSMSEKFKKFPGKSGNFSFRKEFFVGTILEALHAVKNSSQNTQFFETFPA